MTCRLSRNKCATRDFYSVKVKSWATEDLESKENLIYHAQIKIFQKLEFGSEIFEKSMDQIRMNMSRIPYS